MLNPRAVLSGIELLALCIGAVSLPKLNGAESNLETAAQTMPAESQHPGMVWIAGGEFMMGTPNPTLEYCGGRETMDDARPIHRVAVEGFWMDATEVTNAEFARFVRATHYLTVAERTPRAEDFPGADPTLLVPGGLVFTPPKQAVPLDDPLNWWRYIPGADWRHPDGPSSSIEGRENLPVVQIAYEDAEAFARWVGKRLPTEAEWEYAARGGLEAKTYTWGNELKPRGKWLANLWEGHFPSENTAEDGFLRAAPVASYPPNGYGLYDMAGNVWEWCSDWYRPNEYEQEVAKARGEVVRNPQGPSKIESFDSTEPGQPKRVQRGGSFLCTDQYCTRYMVGSRGKGAPDTPSNHVGFRCVTSASPHLETVKAVE